MSAFRLLNHKNHPKKIINYLKKSEHIGSHLDPISLRYLINFLLPKMYSTAVYSVDQSLLFIYALLLVV